jgi:IS4 transposase
MVFNDLLNRFVDASPVSVMFRGTMENIFSPQRMDRLFEETAVRQYCRQLLFSTCVNVMGMVVTSVRKSVNAAHQALAEEITVSVKSLYNKLAGVEPAVSERLVRETAAELAHVIDKLKTKVKGPLPGYDVRIVDGNHLQGTEHRIGELRRLGAAALPGHALVVLDPQRQLMEHVICCEDGHANERILLPRLLELVQRGQCWVADRNFCTRDFLYGIQERRAYFIVRHHRQLHGELLGKRKKLGHSDTGVVYEQAMCLKDSQGREMYVRRITIQRYTPTEKGETEVHLLTNLPAKISGLKVAEVYRSRWRIETGFQDLATVLRSEINTLGYPDAALFGFCIAVAVFNALTTVKAALRRAAQGDKKPQRNLSSYYLADEISGVARGMEIAVSSEIWTATFAALTPAQLAKTLLWLAKRVKLQRFYTNPWTPKRPQPKRISGHRGNHVATYHILQERAKALL